MVAAIAASSFRDRSTNEHNGFKCQNPLTPRERYPFQPQVRTLHFIATIAKSISLDSGINRTLNVTGLPIYMASCHPPILPLLSVSPNIRPTRSNMSNSAGKWWLGFIVICCLVPAAFADRDRCDPHDRDHNRNCPQQQVPEGGSAVVYLLGAGLTCFGAMCLRSKTAKPIPS